MTWVRTGNIRGPQGPIGPTGPPGPPGAAGEGFVGEIRPTIAPVAPAKWLMLNGQTIANGQTVWPELWALPATSTWKSGTNLVLPNMSDRILQGGSATAAVGTVAGANSRAMVVANLPVHTHTIVHTHEFNHNHTIAHTHSIAHNHAAGTTSVAPNHQHSLNYQTNVPVTGTSVRIISYEAGMQSYGATGPAGTHSHTFDVAAFTGNAGASSAGFSGVPNVTTTGGANPATSGSAGGGSAFDVQQAWLRVNWMIKAAT